MKRSFEGNVGVMASLLGNEHAHCTRAHSALRHARKQKKERNFRFSLQYPDPGSYRAEKITEKKVREYISVY